jgi:hypothetical protein
LDFKGDLPSPSGAGDEHMVRSATYVAAFANAEGGDLIVGVAEAEHRAAGWRRWIEWTAMPEHAKQFRSWLERCLRPRDFADEVLMESIAAPAGADSDGVLVVSVPPSIVVVAVCSNQQTKALRFPVRRGHETYDMEYNEVMERARSSRRASYLSIRALQDQGLSRVRFAHRLYARVPGGGQYELLPTDDGPPTVVEVTPNLVVVSMPAFEIQYRIVESTPAGNFERWGPLLIPAGSTLTIPHELIRAAWDGADGFLHLAPDALIAWQEGRWLISVGPTGLVGG